MMCSDKNAANIGDLEHVSPCYVCSVYPFTVGGNILLMEYAVKEMQVDIFVKQAVYEHDY